MVTGQGVISGEPLMVLCSTCGDAIEGECACPTCGELEPRVPHADPAMRLDEALLFQVGVALAAQADLAEARVAERTARVEDLTAEQVVLVGRLRTQAVLLQRMVLERPRMAPAVASALERVKTVLHEHEAMRGVSDWYWSIRARLPRDQTCGTVARRLIGEYVREHLDPVAADDALFVVSELANNAFLHGTGVITLHAQRREQHLRIDVLDDGHSARIEPSATGARDAAGGRGLLLVERLAAAWGTTNGIGHVWAEMPIA